MAQLFIRNPAQSYEASPAIWDHTVFVTCDPTQTRPAISPARQAGTRFI